jgi:hypothetical protein
VEKDLLKGATLGLFFSVSLVDFGPKKLFHNISVIVVTNVSRVIMDHLIAMNLKSFVVGTDAFPSVTLLVLSSVVIAQVFSH